MPIATKTLFRDRKPWVESRYGAEVRASIQVGRRMSSPLLISTFIASTAAAAAASLAFTKPATVEFLANVSTKSTKSWSDQLEHANVAIGGYDATSYFTQGKAIRGTAGHSTSYGGLRWYFATAAAKVFLPLL